METRDIDEGTVSFAEESVPLDDLRETAADLVRLYGGEIIEERDGHIEFELPVRRGVAASGAIGCRLTWPIESGSAATLTLRAEEEQQMPKGPRIAILVMGAIGAMLWMVWPFFPNMGAVAWVGALMAFGAYFLTLKRTSAGIAADWLRRLAREQREGPVEPPVRS